MTENILCLGYLKEPHGLEGEVKVRSNGELLSQQKRGDRLYLYSAEKVVDGFLKSHENIHDIIVESIRPYREGYLIKFEEITTPEKVKKYCRLFIGISIEEARKKYGGSQEPYLFEYFDLQVLDQPTNKILGKVSRIEEVNQRIIFVIQMNGQESEVMLPALSPYIKSQDFRKQILYTEKLHELQTES